MALESLVTESARETGLPPTEMVEGLRGGRGGRCFGGDSRLISGADTLRALEGTLVDSLLAVPNGPSSTTQSLRSINDVFRHTVGDGDLDVLEEMTAGSGAMGCSVLAEGEILGESRRLSVPCLGLRDVADDEPSVAVFAGGEEGDWDAASASKALILD